MPDSTALRSIFRRPGFRHMPALALEPRRARGDIGFRLPPTPPPGVELHGFSSHFAAGIKSIFFSPKWAAGWRDRVLVLAALGEYRTLHGRATSENCDGSRPVCRTHSCRAKTGILTLAAAAAYRQSGLKHVVAGVCEDRFLPSNPYCPRRQLSIAGRFALTSAGEPASFSRLR